MLIYQRVIFGPSWYDTDVVFQLRPWTDLGRCCTCASHRRGAAELCGALAPSQGMVGAQSLYDINLIFNISQYYHNISQNIQSAKHVYLYV